MRRGVSISWARITFLLPESEKRELEEFLKSQGMTLSGFIRVSIQEKIRKLRGLDVDR